MSLHITYHKWNLKENKIFKNSCKEYLNIKGFQIYNPIFSLYFHIHNTKNANNNVIMSAKVINHGWLSSAGLSSMLVLRLFIFIYKLSSFFWWYI